MGYYEKKGREAFKAGASRSSCQYRGFMGAEWRKGYDEEQRLNEEKRP